MSDPNFAGWVGCPDRHPYPTNTQSFFEWTCLIIIEFDLFKAYLVAILIHIKIAEAEFQAE